MKKIKLIVLFLFFGMSAVQSQNVENNGLALELGYGGGDGIFPTYLYGLQYTRTLSNRLSGYAKYNISKGARGRGYADIEEKYILEENTAEFPNEEFGQFVFLGLGLEFKAVKTTNSFLYLIGGLRYTKNQRSRSAGFINENEERATYSINSQGSGFGYEIGIGYKRKFAKKYFVGGSINHTNFDLRFSVSGLVGVYF